MIVGGVLARLTEAEIDGGFITDVVVVDSVLGGGGGAAAGCGGWGAAGVYRVRKIGTKTAEGVE